MTNMKEIELIVNESGNSFHCRVVNYFREKGWHTLISPYYMDSATNKPREIDLIAEEYWLYKDDFSDKYGTVNIKLFIEYKYIPQPIVFWFSDKDRAAALDWVTSNTPLPRNNMYTDRHHYLATNPKVAKLFASKNRPSIENEVIYRALNQSLNAMVYLRQKESIIPVAPNLRRPILETVEMPIILCNSFEKFYSVDMEGVGVPEKIDDNFQLEVNYAYLDLQRNHRSEYFLLDIIDFNKLDSFLDVLEDDKEAISNIIDR